MSDIIKIKGFIISLSVEMKSCGWGDSCLVTFPRMASLSVNFQESNWIVIFIFFLTFAQPDNECLL